MYQQLRKIYVTLLLSLTVSAAAAMSASAEEAIPSASVTAEEFHYIHDPRLNPKAMEDIIENPSAVYGFSPAPSSVRLGQFASYDWSDPVIVENARQDRIAYHEQNAELYTMLEQMQAEGRSIEEIARTISAERNQIRLAAYKDDPEGLAAVKQSNLDTYGNEEGPSADSLYDKYGSWETVLEKAFSINSGMDACLGLYDDYYDLYAASGQLVSYYTVVKGDCLEKIAVRQLGSRALWRIIFQMNPDTLSDPNLIYSGQILKLPSDPSAPGILDLIKSSRKDGTS